MHQAVEHTTSPSVTPSFTPSRVAPVQIRPDTGDDLEPLQEILEEAGRLPTAQADRLREEAILAARPLARRLASHYRGRGIEDDDLEQVAMVGLCKAVRGYEPGRGSFTAYAIPTISGELKRHFRDAAWLVRPTRSLQELAFAIRRAAPALVQELRHQPSPAETAEYLGVSTSMVQRALAAERACWGCSLDVPHGESEGTLGDVLADEGDSFAPVEAAILLGTMLSRLSPRQRQILDLRFRGGLTQEEIGSVIGVSQMQVSRLLASTLATLREAIVGAEAAA